MSRIIFSDVNTSNNSFTIDNSFNGRSVRVSVEGVDVVLTNLEKNEIQNIKNYCYLQYNVYYKDALTWLVTSELDTQQTNDVLRKKLKDKYEDACSAVSAKINKQWINKMVNLYRKKFADRWNIIKSGLDTRGVLVLKAIHATLGSNASTIYNSGFLDPILNLQKYNYFVNDLIKYPAASYALREIWFLTGNRNELIDWMSIFYRLAHKDTSKSVVNRIVMNLPRGLSRLNLNDFLKIQMKDSQVVQKTKIKLIAVIKNIMAEEHSDKMISFVKNADLKEIKATVQWLKRRGLNAGLRKEQKVRDMITYLSDYPEEYHGTFFGLAKRSYRWHQDPRNFARQYGHESVEPDKLLSPSLWDINEKALKKKHKNKKVSITFLEKAGNLYEESTKMNHCVRTYVNKAMKGECYLFHVEVGNELATVEINKSGQIIQARGHSNSSNAATKWCTDHMMKFLTLKEADKQKKTSCTSELQTTTF